MIFTDLAIYCDWLMDQGIDCDLLQAYQKQGVFIPMTQAHVIGLRREIYGVPLENAGNGFSSTNNDEINEGAGFNYGFGCSHMLGGLKGNGGSWIV